MADMKIISLLPSATEIVFALGLEDALEGVTHECDFPAAARTKRVVSGTALPDTPMTAREIDDAVTASVHSGTPIYTLDAAGIRAIDPDLILTQDLCEVCAVPSGAVEDALATLGCQSAGRLARSVERRRRDRRHRTRRRGHRNRRRASRR